MSAGNQADLISPLYPLYNFRKEHSTLKHVVMLFFDLKRLIKYRLIEKYCIYLNV